MATRAKLAVAAFILSASTAAPALAEPALAADYELLSTSDLADGSTRATIAFTFTNTGDVAFGDLFVEWSVVSPFPLFEPAAVPIAVGALAPAAATTIEVALDLVGPISTDLPLLFMGLGEDGGLIVPVDTVSMEATP